MKSSWVRMARSGRDRRRDALDDRLVEGADHPPAGLLAVGSPDDELGDEVVELRADDVALLVAGVGAHAEAVGEAEARDASRAREEATARTDPRR